MDIYDFIGGIIMIDPVFLNFDPDAINVEHDWILPGLRPSTIGLLAATGGVGKSFLVQNLCMAVALGVDIWNLGITKPGHALYLNFEDDQIDMTNRGNSICRAGLGTLNYKIDPSIDTMHIASMFGQTLNLLDRNGSRVNADIEWLKKQCSGMRLVVLDPLSHLHSADENNGSHMKDLMVILKDIAKECNCGILLCQHTAKAATLNKTGDTAEAAKGSITISNTARLNLTLTTVKRGTIYEDLYKLHWAKINNMKRPYDLFFERNYEGVLIPYTGSI